MLNIGDFARLGRVSPRMLRHYHELGLLTPDTIDTATGYRSYGVAQLARLHRLLALRDLGFSLEQIGKLLDDDLTVDQLKGMLVMRRAQMEDDIAGEQARLRRVEAHLRSLEGVTDMKIPDVVIKSTEHLRVAETVDTAPGFGPELGDLFGRLYPVVFGHLAQAGIRPGPCVAWYEEPDDDGTVVVHAGVDIGSQAVTASPPVQVTDLPVVEVAATVYRGSMEHVGAAYEALVRWIEDSGYELAGRSRELYHEWHDDDPTRNVTELQMPIAR